MADTYDLIVIGAGPGGYVAAIRAAQLGMKTALVEKRGALGGTCLNIGCIPSKALLQSSHHFQVAAREFAEHGIKAKIELDLKQMMARKDQVVKKLTGGIAFLMKKNKVDVYEGTAKVAAAGKVEVKLNKGGKAQTLETANILIATGSDSAPLPGLEIDEKQIVTSTGSLELAKVPKRMAVIGAGAIGLEMGSVWRRLGSEVTVIEFLDTLLPTMDGEVQKQATRILKKQGLAFKFATKVTGGKKAKAGVTLSMEPRDGGDATAATFDVVLVAVGRRPYTQALGLDAVGVATDERGFVKVDEDYRTSVDGIYAIGDVIGGAMLAHKAEDEGMVCVEILAGETGHVDYGCVPAIVYTHPEIAGVGKTEEQLKKDGVKYAKGSFPFSANSRAISNADSDGFVKILADAETDRVLGCHIVGPSAGDLIQEVVNVMEFGGSAEDIARTSHGHPGLPEAVREAALAVDGRPIHI